MRKGAGAFRGGVRTLVCLPTVTKISAIRPCVASAAPIVSCRDAIRFVQSGRVILLPELSRRRRLLVLVICSSSLFIVGLDSTIVNIALPSIGRDLHASVAGLQWTVDGYALVLASLLMLSGATADRIGRRRVFQVGLATFTAGSALRSLAPSLGWLVAFRMLQAIGGSMLNPVAMSIITNTFTDKTERARAIGVWGGAYGLSMSLGPVIGGLLVDSIGWRGTFYVNIPIGLAAIALTARFVPESRARRPRRPDPVGQALIVVMLGSLTYAIIEGPALGWHAPVIVTLFAVSAAALAVFVVYEAHRPAPLLDPRFFRSAPFAGAVLTAISATAAVGGFLFLATLYLQDVRSLSAVSAGLHLLPMATMMALGAVVSSRILDRRGARLPMLAAGTWPAGRSGPGSCRPRTPTGCCWPRWAGWSSCSPWSRPASGRWARRPAPPPPSTPSIPAPASREPPGRYGCCPAIFRRAPRSVMVMSRWPVRMMPRCRQLDRARVTVARDAPVRLASSSWVSVIAVWIPLPRQSASSSRRPASRCAPLVTERVRSIDSASFQRRVTIRR